MGSAPARKRPLLAAPGDRGRALGRGLVRTHPGGGLACSRAHPPPRTGPRGPGLTLDPRNCDLTVGTTARHAVWGSITPRQPEIHGVPERGAWP